MNATLRSAADMQSVFQHQQSILELLRDKIQERTYLALVKSIGLAVNCLTDSQRVPVRDQVNGMCVVGVVYVCVCLACFVRHF